ncbi:MAG: adenosylhomocysteinase [Clostridiaceae bacterium]|jgi:adenosylhomocysteinase|nr:adenosylhomocysteinase [Clostridiaceae bacterium]
MQIPEYIIKDIELAPYGHKKIEWAYRNMPVLRRIEKELIEEKPFDGLRIAISVHVEAKTACLAKVLRSGGADVYLTGCNPLSTQDDVAAALASEGVHVYCVHGASEETYLNHLAVTLSSNPHIVIDDGGDFCMLLHSTCSEARRDLIGGCEETTTGVHRLKILASEGRLCYPAIAVNDARCKHLFDNRFGTGQSVWTAIMSATNLLISGKIVVVAGFGMCGKGIALRAKGLGARVAVTEIDPVKACEAIMEGYDVMTMDEASSIGDIFITVTGCKDVISGRHFNRMKNGAICCNAGHFDVEVNIEDLEALSDSKSELRNGIEGYILRDGRTISILAEGRLVNLASGDGHPAEIMDMSFSLQALSARYLALHGKSLEIGVFDIPPEIDDRVARLLLLDKKKDIDVLTPEQEKYISSWDI